MKSVQLLSTIFAFTALSSITMAAQVTVIDVTNQPPQCYDGKGNYPGLKVGECGITQKGTLHISVKLEGNEKPEILDNIHLVIEQNGQFFQYGTMGGPTWEPVSIKGLMTSPPLKSSFTRFPPNSPATVFDRDVYLDTYYTKGTKVYIGVRANDTAGFIDGSVSEAFVVQ
ncbi:MAG: hypothetical protein ABL903_10795 [Methylococcales bacterium]